MILVISLSQNINNKSSQQLLDTFVEKLKKAYHHNKLLIFNTPCEDDQTLRSHYYNQLLLMDTLSPINPKYRDFYRQPTFILGINDLNSAETFLNMIEKNFYLGYDFPVSTVVYSSDRKNFVTDLLAFNKIVVWDDFKKHHLSHLQPPTSPLTNIVNYDWDNLDEYFWFLFLKYRSVNYLELIN